MKVKRLTTLTTAFLTAVLLLGLGGCRSSQKPISRAGFALNTTVEITLRDCRDTKILDGCFDLIDREEKRLSKTVETSDVERLSHAGGKPVTVDAETASVLKTSLEISRLTGGAFDCTIDPVSRLWDFNGEHPRVPDASRLKEKLALVDYRALSVSGNTAQLSNPQASVDLGGIAKGYIADRLKEYLLENHVNSALINLGGNIYAVGTKEGKPWKIGIRDPQDGEKTAATVRVTDESVVTSGVYERYFMQDGVRYHHILDPKTGRPADNGLLSVTIQSKSSTWGDALATACFVLGEEKGMKLVESLDDVQALFIRSDGSMAKSAGLDIVS